VLCLPTSSRSRSRERIRSASSVWLCHWHSRSTARRANADANSNEHANTHATTAYTHTGTLPLMHALTRVEVCSRAFTAFTLACVQAWDCDTDRCLSWPASERPSDIDRSGSHVRVSACDAFARHSSTASRSLSHATSDNHRLSARMLCRLMRSSLRTALAPHRRRARLHSAAAHALLPRQRYSIVRVVASTCAST
jgi:hypothetical protein